MNNIEEKQNQDAELERLASQRCLYSESKKIAFLRTTLALLIAIAFPLLSENVPVLKNLLTAAALGYLWMDFHLLKSLEEGKRTAGAKVQEMFDISVLEIPWNGIVAEERIDNEEIGKCLLKTGTSSFDQLRNWYPIGISKLPLQTARAVCQRANLWWDSELRRQYSYVLTTLIIVLSGAVIWINKDKTVANAVVFFASVIPLFTLLLERIQSHRQAADRLDKLETQVDGFLDDACQHADFQIDISQTRSIQDELFRHRSTVVPIPDFFYNLLKRRFEHLMGFNAARYIQDYLSRRNS